MKKRSYWQDNLRLVGLCLTIWFTVSFGFGILLVDVLDQVEFGGFRLGFWFAQQGSIYVFEQSAEVLDDSENLASLGGGGCGVRKSLSEIDISR